MVQQLLQEQRVGTGNTGTTTNTGAASGNTGAASGNTGSTTLTIDQMPKHKHQINANWARDKGSAGWGATIANYNTGYIFEPAHLYSEMQETGGGKGHTHTLNSHTHTLNNHQHKIPYIECYVWKRTA